MAIYLSAGYFMKITGSTQQPRSRTGLQMAKNIASVIRGENDNDVIEVAKRGLRWAVDVVNISDDLIFGRTQQSDIALVEGTDFYSFPTAEGRDFFGVESVWLYNNTGANTGRPYAELEDKVWADYQALRSVQANEPVNGLPAVFSFRNSFADEGFYIWPPPNAKAVTDFVVKVNQIERVPYPANDIEIIVAPRELSMVLEEFGKYYMLFNRKREDVNGYREQRAMAETMLARYKSKERRKETTKQTGAWRIRRGQ